MKQIIPRSELISFLLIQYILNLIIWNCIWSYTQTIDVHSVSIYPSKHIIVQKDII